MSGIDRKTLWTSSDPNAKLDDRSLEDLLRKEFANPPKMFEARYLGFWDMDYKPAKLSPFVALSTQDAPFVFPLAPDEVFYDAIGFLTGLDSA